MKSKIRRVNGAVGGIVLLATITALFLALCKSGVYSHDVTRQELKTHGVIKW